MIFTDSQAIPVLVEGEGAAGGMPVQYRWSNRECKVVPKVASQVGLQLIVKLDQET